MKWIMLSAVACALSGCATPPQSAVRSAWYLIYEPVKSTQDPKKDATRPRLYVALLNGTPSSIKMTEVIVNEQRGNSDQEWVRDTRITLESGQFILISAVDFKLRGDRSKNLDLWNVNSEISLTSNDTHKRTNCVLPVTISVKIIQDDQQFFERVSTFLSGETPGQMRADLVGRLPSSIPYEWVKVCAPQ